MTNIRIVLKVIWLIAAILIFGYGVNAGGIGEESMLSAIGIMFLTFPLGLIGMWASVLIGEALNANALWLFIGSGVLSLAFGYLQWFMFVPKLISKLRGSSPRRCDWPKA